MRIKLEANAFLAAGVIAAGVAIGWAVGNWLVRKANVGA